VCVSLFFTGFQSNQSLNPVEYAVTPMLMPNKGQQKSFATCGDNRREERETSFSCKLT